LYWFAERLLKAEDYDGALRVFDLLGFLWPEAEATRLLGRGVCLQLRGDLDEAEHAYGCVLSTQPENVYALTNRAEVRLLIRQGDAARVDIERARAILDRDRGPAALDRRVQELREHARRLG
jgi:Flp pilus assembly protein TadD